MRIFKIFLSICFFAVFFNNILISQTTGETETNDTLKNIEKAATPPETVRKHEEFKKQDEQKGGKPRYKVTGIYNEDTTKLNTGAIGDKVYVKVSFLSDLVAEKLSKGKEIVPYIDNLPLKGIKGIVIKDANSVESEIRFDLKMKGSEDAWIELLRKPQIGIESNNQVRFSLGLEDEGEIPSDPNNFVLEISTAKATTQFLFVIILLLILTIYLGKKTAMLCEPFQNVSKTSYRPYSLALTQMAFWFYLVISTFLALFIITKEFPTITGSVLVLIGISSVTALSSVLINYNNISEIQSNTEKLNSERQTLHERNLEIDTMLKQEPLPVNSAELQNERNLNQVRLNEITQISQRKRHFVNYSSRGFWKDILSDSGGISLYRFQIAVWTAVLGYVFVYNVWSNLAMPQFDNTLLALMGISSGTYIGFKIPEAKQ